MPLLKHVLQKYQTQVFVETGSYAGEAIKLAKECGFSEIHSIELDPTMAAAVASTPSESWVHVYTGNSAALLPSIVPRINLPTTYWLDAHPPGALRLFAPELPLLQEILAIRAFSCAPSIILIDDMRLFSLEDVQRLVQVLHTLWPQCKITREDGIEANDVLAVVTI